MPLPRYEGTATPFQQVQPLAAQSGAQLANTLADRLSSWQDTIYKHGAEVKAQEGRDQAVKDITSGDPLKIEKGYGFYAKAYNDISTAAYNSQVERDLAIASDTYGEANKKDPNAYLAQFDSYLKETVKGIQEPEFKAIALKAGNNKMSAKYSELLKEHLKNKRESDNKSIDTHIEDLTNEYKVAFANDNIDSYQESIVKIGMYMQRKVDAGTMLKEDLEYELKKIVKLGAREKMIKTLEEDISSGSASAMTNAKKSPYYQSLTYEERKKADEELFGVVDRKFKDTTQYYELQTKQVESVSKFNKEKYLGDIYLGKGLDERQLKADLNSNIISHDDYKDIMDIHAGMSMGGVSNDPEAELYYTMHLGGIDIHQLKNDNRLTSKRKIEFAASDKHFRQKNREIAAWEGVKAKKMELGSHPRSVGLSLLNKFPMYPSNKKKDSLTKIDIIRRVDAMVEQDPSLADNYYDLFQSEISRWETTNKKVVESNNYDAEYNTYKDKKKKYDDDYNGTFNKLKRKVTSSDEKYTPPEAPKKPQGYIEPKDR